MCLARENDDVHGRVRIPVLQVFIGELLETYAAVYVHPVLGEVGWFVEEHAGSAWPAHGVVRAAPVLVVHNVLELEQSTQRYFIQVVIDQGWGIWPFFSEQIAAADDGKATEDEENQHRHEAKGAKEDKKDNVLHRRDKLGCIFSAAPYTAVWIVFMHKICQYW